MTVSRTVTTQKDHLNAHVVKDLHLMEMKEPVLVSSNYNYANTILVLCTKEVLYNYSILKWEATEILYLF